MPERRARPRPAAVAGSSIPVLRSTTGPSSGFPSLPRRVTRFRPRRSARREGAFESVKESFTKRVGTYTGAKVADFQAVQIKLAEARCLIDSATALMRDSGAASMLRAKERGPDLRPSCAGGRRTPTRCARRARRSKPCGPATAPTGSTPGTRCSATCATSRRSTSASRSISTSPARPSERLRWAASTRILRCNPVREQRRRPALMGRRGSNRAEQRREPPGAHRAREQEALRLLAARPWRNASWFSVQEALACSHPGRGTQAGSVSTPSAITRQPSGAPSRRWCARSPASSRIALDVLHERAVDLERVDREARR